MLLLGLTLPGGLISGLLYVALAVYVGASVVGLGVFGGSRRGRPMRTMLRVGAAVLTLAVLAIALEEARPPVYRRYEILIAAAWVLSMIGGIVDRRLKHVLLGAVMAPTLALLTLFGLLLIPQGGRVPPESQSFGTVLHVVLAILGTVAFTFAAAMGALYVWQIRLMKRDPAGALSRRGPSLEMLDRINFRAVSFGFPLLALSMVGGWLFASRKAETVGSWFLDPTVLATIAGLVVYTLLFLARGMLGWHGRRIAWMTVYGFVFIVVGSVVAAFCTSGSRIHIS